MYAHYLKNTIDKAIELLPEGWSIASSIWVSWNKKKCCPIGAIMVVSLGRDFFSLEEPETNLYKLGLTSTEGYSFSSGFDGTPYDKSKDILSFWKLGREYRERLLK